MRNSQTSSLNNSKVITSLIVAIALLCAAFLSFRNHTQKSESFIEYPAQVIDYHYNENGLRAEIVEYVVNEQRYQKTSNSHSIAPKSIGSAILIKYNPQNPQEAIWSKNDVGILLSSLGVLFFIIGVAILISDIKKQKMNIDNRDSTKIQTPQQNVFFGILVLLFGVAFTIFAFYNVQTYSQKNKLFVETLATVVEHRENRDIERGAMGLEAIVVRYVVDGTAYQRCSNVYVPWPRSIGSQVKIKYNPSSPADCIFVNDSGGFILLSCGVMCVVFGISVIKSASKKRK